MDTMAMKGLAEFLVMMATDPKNPDRLSAIESLFMLRAKNDNLPPEDRHEFVSALSEAFTEYLQTSQGNHDSKWKRLTRIIDHWYMPARLIGDLDDYALSQPGWRGWKGTGLFVVGLIAISVGSMTAAKVDQEIG